MPLPQIADQSVMGYVRHLKNERRASDHTINSYILDIFQFAKISKDLNLEDRKSVV